MVSQTSHGKRRIQLLLFVFLIVLDLPPAKSKVEDCGAQSMSAAKVFSSSATSNSESILVTKNDVVCLLSAAPSHSKSSCWFISSILVPTIPTGTLYSNVGSCTHSNICFTNALLDEAFFRILIASACVIRLSSTTKCLKYSL